MVLSDIIPRFIKLGLVTLVQIALILWYYRASIDDSLTVTSLTISAVCGLIQAAQGVRTFVAYLHYANVNDQLNEYDKLCALLAGRHPDMSRSLLELWSPAPCNLSNCSSVVNKDGGEILE